MQAREEEGGGVDSFQGWGAGEIELWRLQTGEVCARDVLWTTQLDAAGPQVLGTLSVYSIVPESCYLLYCLEGQFLMRLEGLSCLCTMCTPVAQIAMGTTPCTTLLNFARFGGVGIGLRRAQCSISNIYDNRHEVHSCGKRGFL